MNISGLVPLRGAELALLKELQNEGRSIKTGELVRRAMGHFPQLTRSELRRRTPSGTLWWPGRFRYDLDRLKKRGEVRIPRRGYWEITEAGAQAKPVLTQLESEYLDFIEEVIHDIRTGKVPARITTKADGFAVKLGKHIKETTLARRPQAVARRVA